MTVYVCRTVYQPNRLKSKPSRIALKRPNTGKTRPIIESPMWREPCSTVGNATLAIGPWWGVSFGSLRAPAGEDDRRREAQRLHIVDGRTVPISRRRGLGSLLLARRGPPAAVRLPLETRWPVQRTGPTRHTSPVQRTGPTRHTSPVQRTGPTSQPVQ